MRAIAGWSPVCPNMNRRIARGIARIKGKNKSTSENKPTKIITRDANRNRSFDLLWGKRWKAAPAIPKMAITTVRIMLPRTGPCPKVRISIKAGDTLTRACRMPGQRMVRMIRPTRGRATKMPATKPLRMADPAFHLVLVFFWPGNRISGQNRGTV